jgi:RNA polymerase sigma factor (sigma-70 family)
VRYLNRVWPRREEVHDLRQETYVRVYEAAARAYPSSPKSFLFTTARNLMVDWIRRSRIVSIEAVGSFEAIGDSAASNVLIDEMSPERRVGAREELKRLAQAFDSLPPRCREVVWLRRVEELSQKEVAQRLGISERTVESQILKGMRYLADAFLAECASPSTVADGVQADERQSEKIEPEHGQQQTD